MCGWGRDDLVTAKLELDVIKDEFAGKRIEILRQLKGQLYGASGKAFDRQCIAEKLPSFDA